MPRGMVLVAADPAEDWKIDTATCRRPTQVFCLLVVLTHAIKSARHAIEARPPHERPRGPKIDRRKHLGAASLTHRFGDRGRRSPSDQHPPRVNSSTLPCDKAELLHHQLAGKPTSVLDDDRADAVSSTLASSAAKPSATLARIAAQLRSSGGALAAPGSWASRHACRRERACRVARFHR